MQTITLNRTGDRPLKFAGEMITEADTRENQGPGQNRWWELALYRSDSGKYVLAIEYHSQWQGEHASHTAYVCDDAEDLTEAAKAHPYLAGVSGFPPGHDDRQQRLEASLKRCWEQGLSGILAAVEPEML